MHDLLARAVAAHGGLEGFNRFKTVCAHLAIGGALWLLKGQAGAPSKVQVTVELDQECVSFAPFKLPNQRAVFTPQRVADGLLHRHDYVDEVAGNFPVAHYVSDYQGVSGLLIPTKRRAFARRPDKANTIATISERSGANRSS